MADERGTDASASRLDSKTSMLRTVTEVETSLSRYFGRPTVIFDPTDKILTFRHLYQNTDSPSHMSILVRHEFGDAREKRFMESEEGWGSKLAEIPAADRADILMLAKWAFARGYLDHEDSAGAAYVAMRDTAKFLKDSEMPKEIALQMMVEMSEMVMLGAGCGKTLVKEIIESPKGK